MELPLTAQRAAVYEQTREGRDPSAADAGERSYEKARIRLAPERCVYGRQHDESVSACPHDLYTDGDAEGWRIVA